MENVFHPNWTSSGHYKKCDYKNEYIERAEKVSAIVSIRRERGTGRAFVTGSQLPPNIFLPTFACFWSSSLGKKCCYDPAFHFECWGRSFSLLVWKVIRLFVPPPPPSNWRQTRLGVGQRDGWHFRLFNWPSCIEIEEMACSTPAWRTNGLTINIVLPDVCTGSPSSLSEPWTTLSYLAN